MNQAPLPPDVARRLYLRFLAVRLAGLAVMVLGVWLIRSQGQAVGLPVVLLGGASLFVRPRHLGGPRP
ncbi:MAG: hypothetical protein KGQ52_06820 [Alphaproteobacteria bacterium]|nr:hypothetical protein [Alphaproteobacteria bacterium]